MNVISLWNLHLSQFRMSRLTTAPPSATRPPRDRATVPRPLYAAACGIAGGLTGLNVNVAERGGGTSKRAVPGPRDGG